MTATAAPRPVDGSRPRRRGSVPLRAVAKRGLRAYGMVTSPLRPVPDFLVIGAKRCGTTSLHRYLLQHPRVAAMFPAAERKKGVHYFDRNPDRSVSWYRSHFRVGHRMVAGEASPYYLYHPHAAARAAAVAPDAKLIVLLRDPAERAWSHYRDEVKLGRESLSFADAVAAEPSRTEPELERLLADRSYRSVAHEHFTYVSQGLYARHLGRWLEHYPRSQLLVLRSEDLFEDPRATYGAVVRFLGLDEDVDVAFERHNASVDLPQEAAVIDRLQQYYEPFNRDLARLVEAWPGW